MRANQITDKTEVIEYDSLHEFYEYLIHTPFNDAFCWAKHSSVDGDYYFTKTRDFSEAVELFKNGWSDMATKLVQKLKVIESKTESTMKPKKKRSWCCRLSSNRSIVSARCSKQHGHKENDTCKAESHYPEQINRLQWRCKCRPDNRREHQGNADCQEA